MLCFLPPVAHLPRQPAAPRRQPMVGPGAVTVIASLIVGLSILTPIGWSRVEPEYAIHVGEALRVSPQANDVAMARAMISSHERDSHAGPLFSARNGTYTTMPPGLHIEAGTGTLMGSPTMPGTYRVAVQLSGNHASVAVGSTFRIRVLPAP